MEPASYQQRPGRGPRGTAATHSGLGTASHTGTHTRYRAQDIKVCPVPKKKKALVAGWLALTDI